MNAAVFDMPNHQSFRYGGIARDDTTEEIIQANFYKSDCNVR